MSKDALAVGGLLYFGWLFIKYACIFFWPAMAVTSIAKLFGGTPEKWQDKTVYVLMIVSLFITVPLRFWIKRHKVN